MPQEIDREGVQDLMDRGAQVIEVLPQQEYEYAHLPGAVALPLKELVPSAVDGFTPDKPVIVYCNNTE